LIAALQCGGTTVVTQDKTGNVAGGKIQPVAVQHWLFVLFNSYYCFDKIAVQP
jgi:hypothetical protein